MSHYVNRPLLYVSRHHDASLCRYLSQHGWKLVFANSLEDLAALPLDGPFSAGLLDFQSGFSDADLELMEPWLATRQIGWIGAISCADELTDTARKLLGLYFIDYYTAPFDMAELSRTLGHAVGMAALRPGREQPAVPLTRPHGIIGECNAMQALFRSIEKVSRWDTPVLISGESGTGKELAAQAIHRASRRANQPFVAVNCAAIPPTLLMSELFGYERGAFTGATKRKPGRIEIAQGGTLFLDEIGDMPLALQSKLLRALQDREFEPLGSNRIVRSDVRIIAATSADLPGLVAAGRFRPDLYYRLNVLTIELPPLRERLGDLVPMAYAMIEELCIKAARQPMGLGADALKLLGEYDWPGNVRELRNVLERVVMLCDEDAIDAATLAPLLGLGRVPSAVHAGPQSAPESARRPTTVIPETPVPPEVAADVAIALVPGVQTAAPAQSYADAMAQFEAAFLHQALDACGGRVAEAAARIGLSRAAFYKKLAAGKAR
ncbi:MAG TPA: Fis family transcriptional regulator [Cupriavidus sp.]|nr:Fis family transcriptional regulator [Cupriavidus sp.]